MLNALFISDLHLCPSRPQVTQQFIHFLNNYACSATALYILGDFFEMWPGDDCPDENSQQVIKALKQFTETHKPPVYYIHGNRDFLIGHTFCEQTGITLLPDPHVVTHNGERFLLSHGDYLCIDDKPYQRLRMLTSRTWFKRAFMWLPQKTRKSIWQSGRNKSETKKQSKNAYLGDINHEYATAECVRHHCQKLIHGHTHRPAIDQLSIESAITRVTLPAWEDNPGYLALTDEGIQLHYLT